MEGIGADIIKGLAAAAIAIAVDTLLGWILAIRDRKFDFGKMPNFLITSVFPYAGGLLVLGAGGLVSKPIEVMFYAGVGAVVGKFLKDVADKGIQLFGPLFKPPTGAPTG